MGESRHEGCTQYNTTYLVDTSDSVGWVCTHIDDGVGTAVVLVVLVFSGDD